MKGYVWKEGTPAEVEADGAYWERNMMALQYAARVNALDHFFKVNVLEHDKTEYVYPCGWYFDTDNNWEGWKRVITLDCGSIAFHIPDDFEVGNLPQVKANWNGHTTQEKWNQIAKTAGIKLQWGDNA